MIKKSVLFWRIILSNLSYSSHPVNKLPSNGASLRNLANVFAKGALCYIPILADLFPEKSGWNSFRKSIERATTFFKSVISEHENELDEVNEPRDYIDAYLKKIQSTHDQSSSFYKESGCKLR